MAQNEISNSSDSVASAPSNLEASSNAFKDSSFQAPGDNSSNDIWRQVKQGDAGMGQAPGGASGGSGSDIGKQGNTSDGAIDFSAHSDIYGGSPAKSMGESSAAMSSDKDSSGASGGKDGGDRLDTAMPPSRDTVKDGGNNGDGGMPPLQDLSRDSGKDGGDGSVLGASGSNSDSGFERVSAADQVNAPVERLNQAVENNHQNLVNRIDSLGDDMPRVAFHGANAERADAIDTYYGKDFGGSGSADSGKAGGPDRDIFVASPKTTSADAEGKLADMANSHDKADSYRGHGQNAYAFDVSDKRDKDFMTKRLEDTKSSVGAPFAEANQSYEAQMGLSELTPLAKISPADASRVQPDHTAADYQDRIKALEALYRQNAIDKVLSAVENKNR